MGSVLAKLAVTMSLGIRTSSVVGHCPRHPWLWGDSRFTETDVQSLTRNRQWALTVRTVATLFVVANVTSINPFLLTQLRLIMNIIPHQSMLVPNILHLLGWTHSRNETLPLFSSIVRAGPARIIHAIFLAGSMLTALQMAVRRRAYAWIILWILAASTAIGYQYYPLTDDHMAAKQSTQNRKHYRFAALHLILDAAVYTSVCRGYRRSRLVVNGSNIRVKI